VMRPDPRGLWHRCAAVILKSGVLHVWSTSLDHEYDSLTTSNYGKGCSSQRNSSIAFYRRRLGAAVLKLDLIGGEAILKDASQPRPHVLLSLPNVVFRFAFVDVPTEKVMSLMDQGIACANKKWADRAQMQGPVQFHFNWVNTFRHRLCLTALDHILEVDFGRCPQE